MKVRELIGHLMVCPPDAEVEIDLYCNDFRNVGHIISLYSDQYEAHIEVEKI